MSNKDLSMTPPPTPQSEGIGEDVLDYIEYFNSENLPSPNGDKDMEIVEDNLGESLIFECTGENKMYKMKGNYIGSKVLYNLLQVGNPVLDFEISLEPLFPFLEPLNCHLKLNNIFLKIRKNIQAIEYESKRLVNRKSDLTRKQTVFEIRKEVLNIFKTLSQFLSESCDREIYLELKKEIVDLLNFLGPCYSLPTHITSAHSPLGNKCSSPSFHLFHLHLDVRWWCLAILHQIDASNRCPNNIPSFFKELLTKAKTSEETIDMCLNYVIWDLITLIERQISEVSLSRLRDVPGFPCSCAHELAVSVLHLFEHRSKCYNTENFWNSAKERLLLCLKILGNNTLSVEEEYGIILFPPPNFKELKLYKIWWVFLNLAKLYLFDVQGLNVPPKNNCIFSDAKLLPSLIMLSFNKRKPSELELRFYMVCFHSLIKIWPKGKHLDWITQIWGYFSKNLDSNFMIPGINLDGFATLSTSPASIIVLVQSLNTETITEKDNSWHILLKIIAFFVKENELEWRSIKGLIYSKYFHKKMTELGPMGVYNTCLLFLLCAVCCNSEFSQEVCMKLCDLLCCITQATSKKLTQVVLGLLSTAYFFVSHSYSLEPIADKISQCLNSMCMKLCDLLCCITQTTSKKLTQVVLGLLSTAYFFVSHSYSLEPIADKISQCLNSMCMKLCDLLCYITQTTSKKLTQVVLGLLSTAYFLVSHSYSLEPIADKISQCLNSMVQQYTGAIDNIIKREVGQNICLYCEGVKEILEITSDLSFEQKRLFGSSLNIILSQASIVELKVILSCIFAAVNTIWNSSQNLHSLTVCIEMMDIIWGNFQLSLKNLCLSQTPEVIIAQIFSVVVSTSANFSKLSFSKNKLFDYSSDILLYILTNESVSNRIVMNFISNLFQESYSIQHVSNMFPKYEGKIVSLALTALVANGSTDDVNSAIEATFRLPEISELVPNTPACPFSAFQMLVDAMISKYANSVSFQDRISIREKAFSYFGNLDKCVTTLLKRTPLPTHLYYVFKLIGRIFKYGHSLFYVKGKSCSPFANILQAAILPTSIYKLDKEIESTLSDALSSTLPEVICGLNSLSPLLDPCISRYLKDIFKSYIHRYQPSSHTPHPFVIAYRSCSTNIAALHKIFMECIMMTYFTGNTCNFGHQQLVLKLLLDLLQANTSVWLESICTEIFPSLLNLLLQQEDNNVRRCITELLREVFNEESKHAKLRNCLIEHIRVFVASQVAWSSNRVFRILDVLATLNKPLVVDALPGIAAAIRVTEDKRGSGMDQLLRRGYNSLVEKLNVAQGILPLSP